MGGYDTTPAPRSPCASAAGLTDEECDPNNNENDNDDAGPEAGLEYSGGDTAPGCRNSEQAKQEEAGDDRTLH